MSKKAPLIEEDKELDFSRKFIVHGRFPVYHIDNLQPIIDNDKMTIKKIPMGVDGVIVWTYLHVSLKPKQFTDPYSTDTEIRITALEGESWMHIMYNGNNAGNIIEPGDIVIIPKGASFVLSNQSKEQPFVYAIDGNTLLQVD